MRRPELLPAQLGIAIALAGCGGSVSTQMTGPGAQMKLAPKAGDCALHVFHGGTAIPPYVPIASLQYDEPAGWFAADAQATTNKFRGTACQLGADGVILHQGDYRQFGSGTHAGATAFVWARFPTGAAPPTVAPSCEPSCRDGFVCLRSQCVTACNPACASGQRCSTAAASPRCLPSAE